MKKIIFILATMMLFLLACAQTTSSQTPTKWLFFEEESTNWISMTTMARCDDRVVCYFAENGYRGGMSCHTDERIVKRYCP